MVGTYFVRPGVLRFEPQFPLEPGVTYRAIFRPNQLPGKESSKHGQVTAFFRLRPHRSNATTVISHVYPSAEILPENLLKFYVHFSAPMGRGHIYDFIHLQDDSGKEIELPFLEIDEELWNPAMTRLTLFVDPGRIKRGVLPLEEIGPVLEAGKRYRLVIDSTWRDGAGAPLKEGFQKVFSVGEPDRNPPDPNHWKIGSPRSGTRQHLVVIFPEPMDHALAQRVIRVSKKSGELVEGVVALEDHECRWTFVPRGAWSRATYNLTIQTTLEDLAGNSIGKPFEVDLFEGIQQRLTTSTVKLPFEVR